MNLTDLKSAAALLLPVTGKQQPHHSTLRIVSANGRMSLTATNGEQSATVALDADETPVSCCVDARKLAGLPDGFATLNEKSGKLVIRGEAFSTILATLPVSEFHVSDDSGDVASVLPSGFSDSLAWVNKASSFDSAMPERCGVLIRDGRMFAFSTVAFHSDVAVEGNGIIPNQAIPTICKITRSGGAMGIGARHATVMNESSVITTSLISGELPNFMAVIERAKKGENLTNVDSAILESSIKSLSSLWRENIRLTVECRDGTMTLSCSSGQDSGEIHFPAHGDCKFVVNASLFLDALSGFKGELSIVSPIDPLAIYMEQGTRWAAIQTMRVINTAKP